MQSPNNGKVHEILLFITAFQHLNDNVNTKFRDVLVDRYIVSPTQLTVPFILLMLLDILIRKTKSFTLWYHIYVNCFTLSLRRFYLLGYLPRNYNWLAAHNRIISLFYWKVRLRMWDFLTIVFSFLLIRHSSALHFGHYDDTAWFSEDLLTFHCVHSQHKFQRNSRGE